MTAAIHREAVTVRAAVKARRSGWAVAMLALVVDLLSKYLARQALPAGADSLPLLPELLWARLTSNPDGMHGVFALLPEPWKSVVLVGATALLLLWIAATQLGRACRTARVGAALVVGGGLGNLAERLFSPAGVTDFLQFGLGQPWGLFGIFNLADVAIAAGAGLWLWGTPRR